jgi:hypothetical protein
MYPTQYILTTVICIGMHRTGNKNRIRPWINHTIEVWKHTNSLDLATVWVVSFQVIRCMRKR